LKRERERERIFSEVSNAKFTEVESTCVGHEGFSGIEMEKDCSEGSLTVLLLGNESMLYRC
jgi:hypothetical protein